MGVVCTTSHALGGGGGGGGGGGVVFKKIYALPPPPPPPVSRVPLAFHPPNPLPHSPKKVRTECRLLTVRSKIMEGNLQFLANEESVN